MLPHSAEQIMTRNVVTVRQGSSIEEALRLMSTHHISGLPVVDVDGRLVGMITESDVLLRGQIPGPQDYVPLPGTEALSDDKLAEAYRKAAASRVEEAMTRKVVAFGEESSVADIARVMAERNLNRVPIVRDEKVTGIVSRSDIVRSMAALSFDPLSDLDPSTERPRIEI